MNHDEFSAEPEAALRLPPLYYRKQLSSRPPSEGRVLHQCTYRLATGAVNVRQAGGPVPQSVQVPNIRGSGSKMHNDYVCMVFFGTRDLEYSVLGPSGYLFHMVRQIQQYTKALPRPNVQILLVGT